MENKEKTEEKLEEKLFEVTADTVTVEVKDKATGRLLRRELPIDYTETANCLRLRGEGIDGRPAELVFYSDTGIGRLRDLTGGGADSDPCGGHGG
ncbi:MAG: hypothetical protein RR230_03820 [Oscillospiraceae bacterium]